jgi:chorismate synthase
MSGTERGVTLGTPIALFVPNENVRPQDYKEMDAVPRPGHADYTLVHRQCYLSYFQTRRCALCVLVLIITEQVSDEVWYSR